MQHLPVTTARRGRPREFDRDQAITAAMNLFWERGYRSVSASDLATAMQISRSSFYNSFGDKDSVFDQVVHAYLQLAPDSVLAQIGPGEPVMPAFWTMCRELCRVRAGDPDARGCLMVNCIAELAGHGSELAASTAKAVLDRVQQIDRLLRRAEKQGEFPPLRNRRRTATAIVTFLCGINVICKAIRSEQVLWHVTRDTLTGLGLPAPG